MIRLQKFTSLAVKAISLLVILAVVCLAWPQPAPVQAATCSTTHTVVAGETLSSIALKYNTTVEAIATANDLKAPYTIFVGQKLCIPGTSSTPSTGSGSTSKAPNFTAKFNGNRVTVKTSNYPKNTNYQVTLQRTSELTRYKVGILNVKSNPAVSKSYQTPKELRGSRNITVCLKNNVNDKVQCNRYVLPKQ